MKATEKRVLESNKAMTIKYYLNSEYKTVTVFTDEALRDLMGTIERNDGSIADATVIKHK